MRRVPLLLLFIASAGLCAAQDRAPAPSSACLQKVWLGGGGPPPLEYVRLELADDGRGLLAVSYLPSVRPQMYRVTRTKLEGYAIAFITEPAEAGAEPVKLEGTAICSELDVKLIGAGHLKWERKMVLEPEDKVKARIKAVEERTTEYKTHGRPN